MKRRIMISLLVLTLSVVSLAVFSAPAAVLLDTSRSFSAAQFKQAKVLLSDSIPALVHEGPVSLYAFNDTPEKLVTSSTDVAELRAALGKLKQGGRYTLLYDAIFSAAKDLSSGHKPALILLVTDGRDENSAVTLEDAASKAESAHAAIVTVGLGAARTKILRRIAVLSGGVYAGYLNTLNAKTLEEKIRSTTLALAPFAPSPRPIPAATPQQPVKAPPPQQAESNWTWLVLVLLAVAVVLAVIGLLVLLRRSRRVEERVCETCGRKLNIWENECPACLAKTLSITKPGDASSTPPAEAIPELDPALLKKEPSSEELDNTIVLDEIPVLVLKRGNMPQRMFQLPPEKAVSVGRDKVNTISVADKTLSGQHFRIVPKEGTFFLADLGSTNGTFLNGERVTLKELKSGAVIHAGQCDFTFRRDQRRLN